MQAAYLSRTKVTGQTFTDPHELAIFGIFLFWEACDPIVNRRLEILGTVRR